MKKHRIRLIMIGMVVVLTLACSLPGLYSPTPYNDTPGIEVAVPSENTATDDPDKAPI